MMSGSWVEMKGFETRIDWGRLRGRRHITTNFIGAFRRPPGRRDLTWVHVLGFCSHLGGAGRDYTELSKKAGDRSRRSVLEGSRTAERTGMQALSLIVGFIAHLTRLACRCDSTQSVTLH